MLKNKFKQTEIGRIPEDWETVPLRQIANVIMGQSPPSTSYNSNHDGLPFYQGRKDFGSKYPIPTVWCSEPKRIAEQGSVLVSVRAPIGDLNISTETCCIGRGVAALKMKNRNNELLFYLMKFNQDRLSSTFEAGGTVFGCVGKDGLSNFVVAIPKNQHEQNKLSEILSSLDSKIEFNQRINKTLEAIGQALFKHWFIDFEFPNGEGKPYRSSGGEMVKTELGEVPRGWSVGTLSNFGEFKNGVNYSREETGDTTFSIINVRDLVASNFILESSLDKLNMDYKKAENYLLKEGDIVIARSASPGETIFIFSKIANLIYSGFSIRYRPNNLSYANYLFYSLQNLKTSLINISDGTTLKNINQETLKKVKIFVPDNKTLNSYNLIISTIYKKITALLNENLSLSKIRDTLLPKLMSGEIRVSAKS